jgi:anti-anti-sigma factor
MISSAHSSPPPAEFGIDRREEDGGLTLSIQGEIDLATAPRLERELEDAARSSARRIVLDLAALDFIDSSGVCLLVEAQRRADHDGRPLVLTHVPPHARRLFQITGVDTVLQIQ